MDAQAYRFTKSVKAINIIGDVTWLSPHYGSSLQFSFAHRDVSRKHTYICMYIYVYIHVGGTRERTK